MLLLNTMGKSFLASSYFWKLPFVFTTDLLAAQSLFPSPHAIFPLCVFCVPSLLFKKDTSHIG